MKKTKCGSKEGKEETFPLVEPERLIPSAQGEALGFEHGENATLKGSFTA